MSECTQRVRRLLSGLLCTTWSIELVVAAQIVSTRSQELSHSCAFLQSDPTPCCLPSLPLPGYSGYFGGCPVVRVPGFTHPVEDFYLENILQLTGASGAGLRWYWSRIHTALLRHKLYLQLAPPQPTCLCPPRAGYQEAAVQAVGGLTGASGGAAGSNGAAAAAALPHAERARIEEAIEAAFTTGSGGHRHGVVQLGRRRGAAMGGLARTPRLQLASEHFTCKPMTAHPS